MFKDSFKYYKSKQPPPDLSTVLRISQTNREVEVIAIPTYHTEIDNDNIYSGLKPIQEWSIYGIKSKPGLIFIKNPFTALGQRYWITRCLKDFSKAPNKLNIDAHNYLQQNETWWEACNNPKNKNLASKLRWATLGYHHNWDTKIYSEASKNEFPEDLATMCQQIAQVLNYKNFRAEAAIVNYYFMNSTLSGHTDHSEKNLDAPLFSFSFGQSAIFLIGGLTENDAALPILIESGDVLIMSKESRLCYHAVPKILFCQNEEWNIIEDYEDNKYWNEFNMFIKNCRVNMNVRQVLKPGQLSLNSE